MVGVNMVNFYVELHRDVNKAYFVNIKTKRIEGVYDIKKINISLLKKDGIIVKEMS